MKTLQLVTDTILLAGLLAAGGCGSGTSTSNDDSGMGATIDSAAGPASGADAADAGNVNVPSAVVADGYLATGPWAGYGFTATDPGAAQIIPNCGSGICDPPFVGKSFCMHGTVTGRPDYTGFAMLGWNVNQDLAGDAQLTWAVPETGGITVTVDNPSGVPLRVQLQGTNPHIGSDRWCAPLVSGRFIPWGSLLTNCWTGGSPQSPLTPGTPIQQAAIIVPGLQTDLPFDFCLVDVQVQGGQADGGTDGGSATGSDGSSDGGSATGPDGDSQPGSDGGSDGGSVVSYPG
jgi:hypothetical protein